MHVLGQHMPSWVQPSILILLALIPNRRLVKPGVGNAPFRSKASPGARGTPGSGSRGAGVGGGASGPSPASQFPRSFPVAVDGATATVVVRALHCFTLSEPVSQPAASHGSITCTRPAAYCC